MKQRLAPICPTPTNWTQAQRDGVADALEATSPQLFKSISLLAVEWERLDEGARVCRNEK